MRTRTRYRVPPPDVFANPVAYEVNPVREARVKDLLASTVEELEHEADLRILAANRIRKMLGYEPHPERPAPFVKITRARGRKRTERYG
jgi:hypothetical protein